MDNPPDNVPTLLYAQGGFPRRRPRVVKWLIGVDVVFAILVVAANAWVAYWSLTNPPEPFDAEIGVTPNVANPLMATEAIASLALLLMLVIAAVRMTYDLAAGVRLHQIYAIVKLSLAMCFGIATGWSYANESTFPPNNSGAAGLTGFAMFILSAIHPTIILVLLPTSSLQKRTSRE